MPWGLLSTIYPSLFLPPPPNREPEVYVERLSVLSGLIIRLVISFSGYLPSDGWMAGNLCPACREIEGHSVSCVLTTSETLS